MKRSAEKQLTRDDGGDSGAEDDVPRGMQKADASVLASRPMRAMPKRAMGMSPSPNTTSLGAPTEKPFTFGSTTSFGTSPSAGFTFNSPTSNSTSQSIPQFGATSASSSTGSIFSSVSSSASHATKAFASIVNSSSQNSQSALSKAPSLIDAETSPAAATYYSNLRGLNVSYIRAIQKEFNRDPFADMGQIQALYQSLRVSILHDYEEIRRTETPQVNGPSTSSPQLLSGSETTQAPKLAFSMPKPPANFSFGTPPTSTHPKPDLSSEIKPAASAFTFNPPKPTTTSSSFTPFGTSTPSAKDSATENAPTSFFGSSSSSSASKPGFSFGASPFGKPATETKSDVPSQSTPFTFGAGSGTSVFTPTVPASTSGTSTSSSFGSLGKQTSLGSTVGFSFGSTSSSNSSLKPAGSQSQLTAQEGGPSLKPLSPPPAESRGLTPLTEGEHDDANKALGTNPNDEEGEGEEDEETVHLCRMKVFKMIQKEGQPQWVDLGVGFLRLKRHKITDARRMLARNSGNGKVMINFNLYNGLRVTRNKAAISFVGHEDGKKATFRLRVKDEAGAIALMQAIESETAHVKSRESSVTSTS